MLGGVAELGRAEIDVDARAFYAAVHEARGDFFAEIVENRAQFVGGHDVADGSHSVPDALVFAGNNRFPHGLVILAARRFAKLYAVYSERRTQGFSSASARSPRVITLIF